jgi:ABC-type sugar transport system ATPase subunit
MDQMDQYRLAVRRVSKTFPGVKALDDVSFELRAGEVHALVGENGAGKSTLIKILSGLYQPDTGDIELDGRVVEIPNPHVAVELGISSVQQEAHHVPLLSVAENIFLGRPVRRHGGFFLDHEAQVAKASKILDDLNASLDLRAPIFTLSAAHRQLVSIARALSADARVLIFDEPTASLSQADAKALFVTIHDLTRRGLSVIYISHRLEEVFEVADRVTVLRDGHVIGTREVREANIDELITMMIGRRQSDLFVRGDRHEPGDVVLEIEHVTIGSLVHDVSFAIRARELVVLAGLVGSGRTELVRAIYGADAMTSGHVKINGTPVRIRSPRDSVQLGIGLVPEDRRRDGLILPMSVTENVVLASLGARSTDVSHPWYSPKIARRIAEGYVKSLRIKVANVARPVVNLSGGNQQRVVIAKWLAVNPRVLILDEPTQGIDVGAKADIYRLINGLLASGIAILMVSSDLSEVASICDRALVMHRGRLVADLPYEEATEEAVGRALLGEPPGRPAVA